MQIDAHQHFWNPARGDYGWMQKGDPVLDRPYGPQDLAGHLAEHGIEKTVLVQAAATVNETEYMLGLADATPHIAGVVGWIDFERAEDRAVLQRLAAHPKFLGVRPMIHDIADANWMLRKDIQWAFEAVTELDLCFDALGVPRHLENFNTLLRRHPDLRVVIDHCMKPQIGAGPAGFDHWAEGMSRLAETGAYAKFSGLVTEAGKDWTVEDLRPYAAHVFEAFGPARIMWGSDWPVMRLRCEYGRWRAAADELTSGLNVADKARVFGGTAAEFYRLG